jgi:hypothetical protein
LATAAFAAQSVQHFAITINGWTEVLNLERVVTTRGLHLVLARLLPTNNESRSAPDKEFS